MTTESVNFVLSAQDKASSVFNKTKEELALLNDEVQQTSKGSQEGADAVGKLARALGGGWLVDAAAQAKGVSDSVKSMSAALGKGGSSALIAKAGLVGLAGVAGFKLGEIIADYAMGMKAFREQIVQAREEAERMNSRLLDTQAYVLEMRKKDIELFSDTDIEKAKKTEELLAKLKQEAGGLRDAIADASNKLDAGSWSETLTFGQAGKAVRENQRDQIKLNQEILAQKQDQITAMERETSEWTKLQNEKIKAKEEEARLDKEAEAFIQEREKQRQQETDAANRLAETYELQIAQMQMTANEYELMVAMATTSDTIEQHKLTVLIKQKQEMEAQKTAAEETAKVQEEAFQKFAKENAARVKAGQDAKKKQLDDQVKQSEKDIEKLKNDSKGQSFTALSGSDTRMLSRTQNKIDYEARTFELQKKQQELAVKMEAHLKLVAKQKPKQAKILQLIAGGGF